MLFAANHLGKVGRLALCIAPDAVVGSGEGIGCLLNSLGHGGTPLLACGDIDGVEEVVGPAHLEIIQSFKGDFFRLQRKVAPRFGIDRIFVVG